MIRPRALLARLRRLEGARSGAARWLMLTGPLSPEQVAEAVAEHRRRTGWQGPIALTETRLKAESVEAWSLHHTTPAGMA